MTRYKTSKPYMHAQMINCPADLKEHDWSGEIKTEYYDDGSVKSAGVTCAKCGGSYVSHILIIGE